jgi:hypothetical protein
MLTTQESNGEVLFLFAECIGAPVSSESTDYREKNFSHLDDLTIEMHDDALVKNVNKLTGSSTLELVLQLVRYSVHYSSSNLLTESQTGRLVEWMSISGTQWILDYFLDQKTPTTEIFGSNILVSAARLGSMILYAASL